MHRVKRWRRAPATRRGGNGRARAADGGGRASVGGNAADRVDVGDGSVGAACPGLVTGAGPSRPDQDGPTTAGHEATAAGVPLPPAAAAVAVRCADRYVPGPCVLVGSVMDSERAVTLGHWARAPSAPPRRPANFVGWSAGMCKGHGDRSVCMRMLRWWSQDRWWALALTPRAGPMLVPDSVGGTYRTYW